MAMVKWLWRRQRRPTYTKLTNNYYDCQVNVGGKQVNMRQNVSYFPKLWNTECIWLKINQTVIKYMVCPLSFCESWKNEKIINLFFDFCSFILQLASAFTIISTRFLQILVILWLQVHMLVIYNKENNKYLPVSAHESAP